MIKPRRNERETMTLSFLLLVMQVPTFSPIGDMESSAPSVKNIMPRISSTAPIRKHRRMLGEMGATEKHKRSTMTMIGRTATNATLFLNWRTALIGICPRYYLIMNRDTWQG